MASEKGLLKKLKTGIIGLGLVGASYFNANAQSQENYIPKYNTTTHPTLIHKLIEFENEPLNGATTCASLEKNSLDTVIKRMERHIPKKPASELSKKEAQELFLKIDSAMYGQICRLNGECYQTAYMYHAVGDFYDLPIHLVMTPQYGGEYHIFARWDAKRDGHDSLNSENPINDGDFNWDNESRLFLKKRFPLNDNDKYFIEEFFIPQETIEKGIYMKNMSEKEMLAFSHIMRAQFLASQANYQRNKIKAPTLQEVKNVGKMFDEAVSTLDEARKLDSLCMPAYSLKASFLGRYLMNPNSDFKEAMKSVNKALELNPKQPELWNLKGDIQRWPFSYKGVTKKQEDSLDKEAIKCYDKAIDLLEEYIKIELSKKDRPVIGINYAKLYILTDQEMSSWFGKWFAYGDLEKIFKKEKNLEKRYEKLKQRSMSLKEYQKLSKEQDFYKEKMSENPKQYSFW